MVMVSICSVNFNRLSSVNLFSLVLNQYKAYVSALVDGKEFHWLNPYFLKNHIRLFVLTMALISFICYHLVFLLNKIKNNPSEFSAPEVGE